MNWLFFSLTLVLAEAKPIVVIDPGHGGEKSGARGVCGLVEKDLVLHIAKRVHHIIERSNLVESVVTRFEDRNVDLAQRAQMANRLGAKAFVSIHANSSPLKNVQGVETFILSRRVANKRVHRLAERENEGIILDTEPQANIDFIVQDLALNGAYVESQRLAHRVQSHLAENMDTPDKGVLEGPFAVLWRSRMPAILVEIGFLSHSEECKKLANKDYQETIARALATGIIAHLLGESG
ncbi:MAG: N-acetylmuramoyl-L-alanine amidase [Myxococcota bacterium]|jgi:N-acetylmuramoyl-L-alanine amidase|nr:N-acetylmuramoyl-L-alanine amidase [Myxococcota bacterium]